MRLLSKGELDAFFSAIPERSPLGERDRQMFTLMLNSSFWVSELVSLNVKDVTDAGQLRSLVNLSPRRQFELAPAAQVAIARLLDFNLQRGFSVEPHSPLLVTQKHTRLSISEIYRLLRMYSKQAGLALPVTAYALRVTGTKEAA